jgi:hypothetical protein
MCSVAEHIAILCVQLLHKLYRWQTLFIMMRYWFGTAASLTF